MVINSSFHIPPCASIIPITSCKYVGLLTLTQYTPYRRTKGYKIFLFSENFYFLIAHNFLSAFYFELKKSK